MVAQKSSAHKKHNPKKHSFIVVAFETVFIPNIVVSVIKAPRDWIEAVKLFNKTHTILGKGKISNQMSVLINANYTSHLVMEAK